MTSDIESKGKPDVDPKETVLVSVPASERADTMPGHDAQILQAETRTEQAEQRTEQAETRTEQAKTRTEEAEMRTEQAETRTEQAKTRTEQAETRTEQAEARSEQAIHESEVRYRRLFETAQDGILILDAETGQVVDANPFMEHLLGYSLEEFLGRKLWEIVPFKGEAASKIAFAELQHKDRLRYEGLPLEAKDGKRVEVEFISNTYVAEHRRLIQCNIRDITERRRTNEVQLRLAAIVNSSDDAIIGKTLEEIITSWNPGAEKVFGYSAAETIGQSMLMLVPPERESEKKELLAKIGRGESVRHYETVRVCKDGKRIDVSVTLSSIADCNGKIIGVSKIARDITEHKKMEAALRESEKRFRSLVVATSQIIWVTDGQGQVRGPIPSFQAYTGQSDEEVQGAGWSMAIHPEDLERTLAAWQRAVERKSGYETEYRLRGHDGAYQSFAARGAPILAEDGNISEWIGTCIDITERKTAEDALRVSEEEFRAMFEMASIGMAQADPRTGKWLRVNQKLCAITGYSVDEMLRMRISDLTHVEDRKHDWELFKRVVRGELPDYRLEKRYVRKDGTLIWVNVNMTIIRDAAGQPLRTMATIEDITERRKLEEQFRQSQKMDAIGQLASGVAHDFNNILAVIQMQSELLKSGENLSPTQKAFADEISAAVQRAATLTRQLLLFSRKEILRLHDLDLGQSINNMTQMLRRILGEHIQMQFKFAMQSLFIHADAGMMDQVLMNLAVNSRDAMPNGGQLVIETTAVEFDELAALQSPQARPGSFVCLSVSDTGCGIPPENLTRIFEPFFTTKDVGKGTGLGLATVFGIVQQHQGWINVYSEGGHGTTFRIYIPRLEKISPEQTPAQPTLTAMPGGKETIFLVEDDTFLRASVRNALTQLGYRVLEAPNGVEALEIWKQNRDKIHLLLTDMVMSGGITGKDLGKQLLHENPKLKVIYVSGYSAEVAGKDFPLEEGVNFLTKPFQATKLAQTIRTRLDY